MLDNSEENRATHCSKDKESRESHVVFQEIGEIVVVEEYQQESDGCDQDDEDEGVEERAFELFSGGIGGAFHIDEIGGGSYWIAGGGGGGGERVD